MEGTEASGFPLDLILAACLGIAVAMTIRMLPKWLAGVPYLKPEQLQERIEANKKRIKRKEPELVLMDVRRPTEFAKERLAGSVNIPLDDIASGAVAAAEEMREQPIALICATGNRSGTAARKMKKAGFSNLVVLDGGVAQWKRRKLPVIS
ncbi:MAG: rhodanese-like domain-containing protein [Rhodospirillaceae bacterium]